MTKTPTMPSPFSLGFRKPQPFNKLPINQRKKVTVSSFKYKIDLFYMTGDPNEVRGQKAPYSPYRIYQKKLPIMTV